MLISGRHSAQGDHHGYLKPRTTSPTTRPLVSWNKGAFVGPKLPLKVLLGHTKLESTVRYLGVDAGDALTVFEGTEV